MISLPRISIVIPSYNKVEYIGKTLESIVTQDYPNFEVIIQDGGSTDGTLGIIKSYAKKAPKLVRYEIKKDKGQVDAINKGLKKAKGDVLSYINADDVYEPGALNAVGKAYIKTPNSLWYAGKGKVINKEGQEIAKMITIYKNFLLSLNSYTLLLMTNYFMQPSVFLTKQAVLNYGPFSGFKGTVIEYELWLKLGKVRMPTLIDKYISKFRLYSEGKSISAENKLLDYEFDLLKNYTKNPLIKILHSVHNSSRMLLAKRINN